MTTLIEAQLAFAQQLAEADAEQRREAAEQLLAMADKGYDITEAVEALLSALDDSQSDVRVTAARTLLRPAMFSKSLLGYVEVQLSEGGPDQRARAGEAILAMARCRWDRSAVSRILLPFLAAALQSAGTSAERGRVLGDIATVAKYEVDMSQTVDALIAALGDRSLKVARGAAKGLGAAVEQRIDISEAVPALEAGLSRGGASPSRDGLALRYSCAEVLAKVALERGDAAAAEQLVQHADGAVREGAVIGLVPVSHPNYGTAVGALTAALDDPSGAVLYFAMMRLAGAVKNGVAVGPAVARLEQLLEEFEYGGGWTFGMDDILSSDMAQEQPRADAAEILSIHYASTRQPGPLRAQLAHGSSKVRAVTRETLEKLARSGDSDRREWLEALLQGAEA